MTKVFTEVRWAFETHCIRAPGRGQFVVDISIKVVVKKTLKAQRWRFNKVILEFTPVHT
jgi:hypothetical protein